VHDCLKGVVFFLLTSLFPYFIHAYTYNITVVAITQSEHAYLEEWIEYHRLIGVDHFCIYDNNDNNDTKTVLQPYIEKGIVEYVKWPNRWPNTHFTIGCQPYAYEDALFKLVRKTKWISFIDTDEFILPTKYLTLNETLDIEYEDKPLIYVPPPARLLSHLTRCSRKNHPMNKWGKVIARSEYLFTMDNPHIAYGYSLYANGSGTFFPCYTLSDIVQNNHPVQDEFLRINHYTFRDEWFFLNVKLQRLLFLGEPLNDLLKREKVKNQEYSETECFKIIDLMEQLRRLSEAVKKS
jgi:hypothetical protein